MKNNLDFLTVKFSIDSSARLTETWHWLIGTDKKVLLISAIGDMFLLGSDGNIYWLDVGQGKLEIIATDKGQFDAKLTDAEQVNEWFLANLTKQLRSSDKTLKDGQVYSYYKLPILGGDYVVDNFAPLSIEEHFRYLGDIHKQIKDLPDGTEVEIKVVD
jgi:hypothetical protein